MSSKLTTIEAKKILYFLSDKEAVNVASNYLASQNKQISIKNKTVKATEKERLKKLAECSEIEADNFFNSNKSTSKQNAQVFSLN